jgi:F-type H+-transporting ATPase subunit b
MKATKVFSVLLSVVFILGAGMAFASGGHGEEAASPFTPWVLLWRVINTICLVGLLIYFLTKPLKNFFVERKAQIHKDLDEANALRARAEEELKEYEKKLAGMENELEKMRAELKKLGAVESDKVVANAERMSQAMVEAAKLAADQEVRKAKAALKTEAAELAVELAEALVREKMNEGDHERLVAEYLDKVGGMK